MGQTATGKNSVATELAVRLDAEIISVDSMKVYSGLDIGTSKPTDDELKAVRHHLISITPPDSQFSVARFIDESTRARDEIESRRKNVIYTGGTFLYYKALVYGFNSGIRGDPAIREEIEAEYVNNPENVYGELKKRDPATAAKITVNDKKRIIRALEYYKLTGKPLSENQTHFTRQDIDINGFALISSPRYLRNRIKNRAQWMMDGGLIEETKTLLTRYTPAREVTTSIGYKEAISYLDNAMDKNEMLDSICKRTWQLARKQMTWIRSLKELETINADGKTPSQIADEIALMNSA